ncbi:SDR family NAD(P)-dependent oxidoreductase [Ktedonosporobacter rubrisoli]|uniref:SDR family NAD(P)-dependent oxidoreductase n=1 Tax=Ktedonosporobacter rubrisoli TaxID=2509675 RepID=A0A4P6JYJ1_KTERU|nr:SDR family NAD(P)-dependent oxidoreductase [Ktedonosporobacter rubrisoli]QBD80878.1 SDR family NAD(P)-dependent oxidoreductase [Ktedonosporobacter rubrisoli]
MTKVWFITGASRGLGREWAEAALERGDKVAVTARKIETLDELVQKFGANVLPLQLDVTNRAQAFNAVEQAAEHFGSLDVVINNAGYGHFGMVEELSEDDVRAQMETNFFGTLWVTQAAQPIMRKQQAGRIIQVTSEGGIRAFPNIGAYHASKWAVEGLSQALAQEVKPFGIHITCLEPGPYSTGWLAVGSRKSKENPDYQVVRDSIEYGWELGTPRASRAGILQIVDADQPPLRIFFGKSLEPIIAEYKQRLATWDKWLPVSIEAYGASSSE